MKNGQTMELTKVVAALSVVLLFGCNDITPNKSSSGTRGGASGGDEGQYAILTNMEAGSSGQMRYEVAEKGSELTTGQVNVSVLYSSAETETAYLTLYDSTGKSADSIGEIQLDSGKIKIRTGGKSETQNATFTTGEWVNLNITWDVVAQTFTASVGGDSLGSFSLNNSAAAGVATVGFKIGNNALTFSQEFLVDDLEIYSDVAGTTEVFIDDYESYVFEELLDGSGDPYKSETQPATVGGEAVEEEETDSTQVAAIADTDSGDTGELRYKLSNTLESGQVSVSLLYAADEDQSAYVTVYSDGGTSTSNQIADLKLDDGKISLRGITVGGSTTLTTFIPGNWVDVQINWETDGTGVADVTFAINGTTIGDTYEITYDTDEVASFVGTGAEVVSIRYVDNGGTTPYTLYADDLSITDGTTEVFSDDFEDYDIDELLDGTDDDYNNNSSEATVVTQPE